MPNRVPFHLCARLSLKRLQVNTHALHYGKPNDIILADLKHERDLGTIWGLLQSACHIPPKRRTDIPQCCSDPFVSAQPELHQRGYGFGCQGNGFHLQTYPTSQPSLSTLRHLKIEQSKWFLHFWYKLSHFFSLCVKWNSLKKPLLFNLRSLKIENCRKNKPVSH